MPDSEPVIARAVLQVKTPELLSDHQEIVAKLATLSMDELGEKLTTLLKDQIHFQLNKQQQISTIRLDPPSLGKLEIAVQLDNGKLMVHIGANQSEVCRALQQFSDDLRQHLTAQNFYGGERTGFLRRAVAATTTVGPSAGRGECRLTA